MDLSNKTAPWVAASLIAAASLFGQNSKCPPSQKSFEQGHELMQNQLMPAYNAPARIDVRGSWDVYVVGTFTYWQALQENMELGVTDTLALANSVRVLDGRWVDMDFDYKPGFKVGIGMNTEHDNWDLFAEYTWFRGRNTHHTHPSPNTATGTPVIAAAWGHPRMISGDTAAVSNLFQDISEAWKLHMDIGDVEMARWNYVGTKLTFRPFYGVRGAWIRQRVHVVNTNTNFTAANAIRGVLDHVGITNCWGVGPRFGLDSNWLIGEGFRLFGNGSVDLLYTRYTSLRYYDRWAPTTGSAVIFHSRQNCHPSYLRTHLDLELGLGWASYFDNNNWHIDLGASYDFQVFFDQMMFRKYVDDLSWGTSFLPNGNLYVHGLNATLRLDF